MSHDQTQSDCEYDRLYEDRPTTSDGRADRYILLARKGWANTRAGDDCFESGDGEEVLALLFDKIRREHEIRALLVNGDTWLSNRFRREERESRERVSELSYPPGHPWYYVLGGKPLKPREIFNRVRDGNYRGYMMAQIEQAHLRQEPRRSILLRDFKERSRRELFNDLGGYRRSVRELSVYRKSLQSATAERFCHETHQSICLKFNHLVNDIAHLILANDLLNQSNQLDLL